MDTHVILSCIDPADQLGCESAESDPDIRAVIDGIEDRDWFNRHTLFLYDNTLSFVAQNLASQYTRYGVSVHTYQQSNPHGIKRSLLSLHQWPTPPIVVFVFVTPDKWMNVIRELALSIAEGQRQVHFINKQQLGETDESPVDARQS